MGAVGTIRIHMMESMADVDVDKDICKQRFIRWT